MSVFGISLYLPLIITGNIILHNSSRSHAQILEYTAFLGSTSLRERASENLDVCACFAAFHMLGRCTKKLLHVFGGKDATNKVEERVIVSFCNKIHYIAKHRR